MAPHHAVGAQMTMQQGQAYGIVVDGFNGDFGQYTLTLTSSSVSH